MRGRVDNVDWSLSDRKMKGSLCSASAFFMILRHAVSETSDFISEERRSDIKSEFWCVGQRAS